MLMFGVDFVLLNIFCGIGKCFVIGLVGYVIVFWIVVMIVVVF